MLRSLVIPRVVYFWKTAIMERFLSLSRRLALKIRTDRQHVTWFLTQINFNLLTYEVPAEVAYST